MTFDGTVVFAPHGRCGRGRTPSGLRQFVATGAAVVPAVDQGHDVCRVVHDAVGRRRVVNDVAVFNVVVTTRVRHVVEILAKMILSTTTLLLLLLL